MFELQGSKVNIRRCLPPSNIFKDIRSLGCVTNTRYEGVQQRGDMLHFPRGVFNLTAINFLFSFLLATMSE